MTPRKEWPEGTTYIDIRKRVEYENPTLSYYGVDPDWKGMTPEEEKEYYKELEALGDDIIW